MGCWEVVGGGDKGGILVRAGQGTSSVSWICHVFFSKFLDSFGIGGGFFFTDSIPWYSSPLNSPPFGSEYVVSQSLNKQIQVVVSNIFYFHPYLGK